MWQKLSLRMRLNALFALVLILGLAINVGRLLLEAGPRVQAEDESTIRLAREFIVASVGGLVGSASLGAYCISKAADMQLARNLAVEWGPHNICVNCIAPGIIRTNFSRALFRRTGRNAQGVP